MKLFRYIIADLFDGNMKGTDSTEWAENVAQSEDHFVYDTEEGKWILSDGARVEVTELQKSETSDEE